MTPRVTDYIGIEATLQTRLLKAWRPMAAALYKRMMPLLAEGKYDEAMALVKTIDLGPIATENREYIKVMLWKAAEFGAKQASNSNVTALAIGNYDSTLNMVADLFVRTFILNVTKQVHDSALQSIARLEEQTTVQKADSATRFVRPFVSFRDEGDAMVKLVSSLHTSRLATWGFTAEAEVRGITTYKLSAVIDHRTSDFCLHIDGREFEVADARARIVKTLAATDPDDLKELAPWPNQSKAGMRTIQSMSTEELAAAGYSVPPFHPNCYDDKTQVYTRQGFKLFKDVDIKHDEFWSLPMGTRNPEWVRAVKFVQYQADYVWRFASNGGGVCQIVSENHNMLWGQRVDRGKAGRLFELRKGTVGEWIQADRKEAKIYCSSEHIGINPSSIPFAGKFYNPEILLKFLGYYLSEGSVKNDNTVSISQHKHHDLMASDLACSFKVTSYPKSDKIDVRGHMGLGKACRCFGHSHQKYVPEFVKNLSPELINVFLQAYALGDGSVRETGLKFFGVASHEMIIYTSSIRMRDDLTELFIKAGYSASFSLISLKGSITKHANGVYASSHDVWAIHRLTSKARSCNQLQRLEYGRAVYDVELERNHTLLVEREGKVSWGSNCRTICVLVDKTEPTAAFAKPQDPVKGQVFNTATSSSFSEMGYKVTDAQVRHWNSVFKELPANVISMMSEKTVADVLVNAARDSIRFLPNKDISLKITKVLGRSGKANLNAVFDPFREKVFVNYIEFKDAPPADAAEYLKRVYRNLATLSESTAIDTLEVMVNGEVSAYAHAKMGFVPTSDEWAILSSEIKSEALMLALTPMQQAVVRAILNSGNPKALWALAELNTKVDGMPLGRLLLENKKFQAILNLRDAESMHRLGWYL